MEDKDWIVGDTVLDCLQIEEGREQNGLRQREPRGVGGGQAGVHSVGILIQMEDIRNCSDSVPSPVN